MSGRFLYRHAEKKMSPTIKKILIVAGIAAVIFSGGYSLGRFTTPAKTITVEGHGRIEYRDRPGWGPTTNAGACCVERNAILAYLDEYLSAPPIVDEVTRDRIRFHVMSNRYALSYVLHDSPRWHVAPVAGGTLFCADGRVYPLVNVGASVDYASVGGQIIAGYGVSIWSVSAMGYVRF
jgi:hypothetical protein